MPGDRAVNLLKYAATVGAIQYPIIFLLVAARRISYPFELEWIEGEVLEHVKRVGAGQILYVAPSLDFIALPYTPLYYYICAVAAAAVGKAFTPLRLVSLASSLGCFLLIFSIVRKETRSVFPAIVASGLFAATFSLSGWWFDVARVDMLFVLFLLGAIYCLRFHVSLPGYVVAGILTALSFLTKQTALPIALPLLLYTGFAGWRYCVAFAGSLGIVIAGTTIVLNEHTGGWYLYYVLTTVSKQQPIDKSLLLVQFWTDHMMRPLAVAILGGAAYLYLQLSGRDRDAGWFYLLAASGALVAAAYSLAKWGGWLNTLVPAHAMIAILLGLGIHSILVLIRETSASTRGPLEIFVYLACLVQFGGLVYNPLRQIPSERDLQAGKTFLETLAQIRGNVFIPYHPYLLGAVGKSVHAHESLLQDVLTHDDGTTGRGVRNEIERALRHKKFAAIILDDYDGYAGNPRGYWKAVETHYVFKARIFHDKDVFFPVAGGRIRPEFLYVPREDP